MMRQRVLVTGAGGFVCSNIVDALLEAGWYVLAADRVFNNPSVEHWRRTYPDQHEVLTCDVQDLPKYDDLDALIHGAAVTAGPAERGETPESNFRANLDPALYIMSYAQRFGVGRTLLISSDAIFRGLSVSGAVDETQPMRPLGVYSVAKYAIERLGDTLKQLHGRDLAVMRLGSVYGRYERARPSRPRVSRVAQMLQTALTEGVLHVSDEAAGDWTLAHDIGRAAHALLSVPELPHSVYNVNSGQFKTVAEIGAAIQQALPAVQLVHQQAPPNPPTYSVSERLAADTGFADWTPFADGIRQTLAWHQAQADEVTL